MATTLTATALAGDPPPVQLDILFDDPTGLTGWQLDRVTPTGRRTIWLFSGAVSSMSVVDYTPPLAVPVSYVLTVTRADLTTFTVNSNEVTVIGSGGCYLTSTVNGRTMSVTLVSWPQRVRPPRWALLDVLNREDVVGLVDLHGSPAGQWSLYTATDAETDELTALLITPGAVVLRTMPGKSIKDVTVLVGRVTEQRYTDSGRDQRRTLIAEIQEVGAVPGVLPLTSTLGGLANLVPTTLANLAQLRPTLLALSQVQTG